MILEGIVTTQNDDGSTNTSPMGPIVDSTTSNFTLRPFQTSTTYKNLKRSSVGVLHVTDDVLLLAQAAIGQPTNPQLVNCESVGIKMIADCCRWYAFRVETLDDQNERTRIECKTIDQGRVRDFFGFNRAKHAVIEAAILATRVHILDASDIASQLEALRPLIEKTGGERETEAFALLDSHIKKHSSRRTD